MGVALREKRLYKALCLLLMIIISLQGCGFAELEDKEIADGSGIFESVDAYEIEKLKKQQQEIAQKKLDELYRKERYADPEEKGIHRECLTAIEDIINSDIEYGFTSASLCVVKGGKIVYENAFGKVNTYNTDGSINENSKDTTTDTLFDLASVTKMVVTNYALQKLYDEGRIDLDEKICSYLGDGFYEDVLDFSYAKGEEVSVETQKKWKSELTIKDLLIHQGGFPADPRYFNPNVDAALQEYKPEYTNVLYSGNSADEKTKKATIEAIGKTPLLYEPGTKTLYSDVDYMVLGTIVEAVTGKDLDSYAKETFFEPMGLKHITFNPLKNGFDKDDCASTELNGNTRDGNVYFDGIRDYTLRGEVHDEKAYYCMGGVSGHAGLFSNASDLALLGSLMLDGTYKGVKYFSKETIDYFTAPKSKEMQNWGLGWWRQGEMERVKYFGSRCSVNTFGHQGWTGTLLMIDPDRDIVIAYLTNKISSPVTSKKAVNKFNGNYYTAASLGFVPEIIYMGMDNKDADVKAEIIKYMNELDKNAHDSIRAKAGSDHPSVLNAKSTDALLEKYN
ncbi:MAG: penicillin binding protein PBP4B [Butyrivibrio sp.]|nr:penicillin binding protein PBP4B [Butyrivibrio sp.]